MDNKEKRDAAASAGAGYTAGKFYADAGLYGTNAFLGQTGTGKSYLVSRLIRKCQRVLVIDPTHHFNGTGQTANALAGFISVYTITDLVNHLRRHRNGRFRIIYKPGYDDAREFEAVCRLIWEVRNCVFVVDELANFCNANYAPPALRMIARAGRHRGLVFLYTSQMPQSIDMNVRRNTRNWYLFRLAGVTESLRDYVPADALARVASLPDRVHIHSNDRFQWRQAG